MNIVKTTFTFDVLHEADNPLTTLDDALYAAEYGDAVGNVVSAKTEPVDSDNVTSELVAMGNDGTFFSYLND